MWSPTSKITLPSVPSDFKDKKYWDTIFNKQGTDAFEWYGEYSKLCAYIRKYICPKNKILVVGCGNSQLSSDIYDDGYFNITNIDISDVIIKKMRSKNAKKRSKMTWSTMDVTEMEFEDSEFSVVIDKGTLDALMPDESDDVCQTVDKMFRETERVLQVAGRFIIVTLLQDHILNYLIRWFGNEGWFVRVHRCDQSITDHSRFPVFVVVCTKLKKLPRMKSMFELCVDSKVERITDPSVLVNLVHELQHRSFVCHHIATGKCLNDLTLELCDPDHSDPRYILHVVDRVKFCKIKFASFLVPLGRECEWLFGTQTGMETLADSSDVRRLVVVHMSRNHKYENMQLVEAELGPRIMELAPKDVTDNNSIPFLSLGQDLEARTVVFKGHSELTGDYTIEDVEDDHKQFHRRLIFESTPNVIQSEMKLKQVKRKGKKKTVIDSSPHLACEHHHYMVAGLGFLYPHKRDSELQARVLILGLGGGMLPMYMHAHFPQYSFEVVEIDPAVLNTATSWFGFKQDERMKVIIQDGLVFIDEYSKAGELFDFIMVDVDNKVNTLGLSCPSEEFVEYPKLQQIKKMLKPGGICVMNLVSRNSLLKDCVIERTSGAFGKAFTYEVEEDVNTVVYCIPHYEMVDGGVLRQGFESISKMCTNGLDIDSLMENLTLKQ